MVSAQKSLQLQWSGPQVKQVQDTAAVQSPQMQGVTWSTELQLRSCAMGVSKKGLY